MSTKAKKDKGLKNDPFRFEGDGISFKGKLIGSEAVSNARGDRMCADAMARLKSVVKASGEHKQRVSLTVSLEGIKVFDEKTHELMCHHPVHRISFISQDQTDPRAFGYVSGTPQGGHSFIAIKTEKAASQIVIALRDLFQVVLEMKQHEMKRRSGSTSHQTYNTSGYNSNSNDTNRCLSSPSTNHENAHEGGRIEELLDSAGTLSSDAANSVDAKSRSSSESSKVGLPEITVVDNLLDLQTELDCLQQGIEQMEGEITTAEAAFGADPFGSTHEVLGQLQLESNGASAGSGSSAYFQPNKVCLPPVSAMTSGGVHATGSSSTTNFSSAQTSGGSIATPPSVSMAASVSGGRSNLLLPPPPTNSLPSTPKKAQTRRGGGSTSTDLGISQSSATTRAASVALPTRTGEPPLDASSTLVKGSHTTTVSMTLPKGFTPGGMPSTSWANSNSAASTFTASTASPSQIGFGDSFDDNFASLAPTTAGSLTDGGCLATSFVQKQQQWQQQQRNAGVTGLFSQTFRGPSTAPPAPSSQTQFSFEGSTLSGGILLCTLPPPPVGHPGHQRGVQQMRSATSSSSSSSIGASTTMYNHASSSRNLSSNSAAVLADSLARASLHDAAASEAVITKAQSGSRGHTTELSLNQEMLSTIPASTASESGATITANGEFNAVFENARPNSGLIGQVASAPSVDSVFDDFRFDGGPIGSVGDQPSSITNVHQTVQRESHFSAAQFSFESVASSSNLSRGRTQESTELFDQPSTQHSAQFDIAPLVMLPLPPHSASGGVSTASATFSSGTSGPRSASGALGSTSSFGSLTVHSGSELASPRFMPAPGISVPVSASPLTTASRTSGNLVSLVITANAPTAVGGVPPADKYAVFEELKQEEKAVMPTPPPISPARAQAFSHQIAHKISVPLGTGKTFSAPASLPASASTTSKSADLFADFSAFGTSPASMPATINRTTAPLSAHTETSDIFFSDSGVVGKSPPSSVDGPFANFENSASSGFGSIFDSNFVGASPPSRTASTSASSHMIQPQSKKHNTQTTVDDFFGESTVAFKAHFDEQFPTQSDVQSSSRNGGSVGGAGTVMFVNHGSTASSNSNGSETGSAKRPPMLNAAMRSNPFCALSTDSTPSEDFSTPPVSSTSAAPQQGSIPSGGTGQIPDSGPRGQKGVTSSSNDNSVCSPSEATTATNAFVSAASSPSSDRFVTMASGSSLSSSDNDLTSSSPPPNVAPLNATLPASCDSSRKTSATTIITHSSPLPPAFPPFAFDAPVAPAVTFASPVAVVPPSPVHGPHLPSAGRTFIPGQAPFSTAASHKNENAAPSHSNVSTAANPFCMGSFTGQVGNEQQRLQLPRQGETTFVVPSSGLLEGDKDRDEGFSGSNVGTISPYPTVLAHVRQQQKQEQQHHKAQNCSYPDITAQNIQTNEPHFSQAFPPDPSQLLPKVSSCALESRNGSVGIPFGHAPFVAHFPTVFPANDEAQPTVSAAGPPRSGIFSKKDDPFNEDFFNMLNSSAGPDTPGQQQQIDSFWCR
ncbi:hypothetical protein BIW11_10241 [Tropilaelaps mercedesae]|uniref:PID domain-containing protein n=1 Tax=Tropilaelaps mercedesae TaxID=418985 RepID=A0A1V9XGK4_9ACAR|nr:hypothetical protein BIW11_10241 [Tropilaelaps mercedesae]